MNENLDHFFAHDVFEDAFENDHEIDFFQMNENLDDFFEMKLNEVQVRMSAEPEYFFEMNTNDFADDPYDSFHPFDDDHVIDPFGMTENDFFSDDVLEMNPNPVIRKFKQFIGCL